MNDEELYLQATNEVDSVSRNEALWAKSMALTDGDVRLAKYKYINLRVEQLSPSKVVSLQQKTQANLSDSVNRDSIYCNLPDEDVIKKLNQPFTDFKNFPRGFSKSGDFGITQSRILENFGNAFIALEDGLELRGIELKGKKLEELVNTPEARNAWTKYNALIKKTKAEVKIIQRGKKTIQRGSNFLNEPLHYDEEDREVDYGYKDDEGYS